MVLKPEAFSDPRSLQDLTFPALEQELRQFGVRPVHAKALWRALHRDGFNDLETARDFPPPLSRWLMQSMRGSCRLSFDAPEVAAEVVSNDGLTRKILLMLADKQVIEAVLMSYRGRFTGCISTQVGCAMGCVFCATGQMGFRRHLRAGEIVAQALHMQRILRARGESALRNLVLMGMGEPLHNYAAVMTALQIVTDTRGMNIGPKRITISTVGVVPGIERLAIEKQPYNLAVSLHAATQAERAALVPASRRWPLHELIAACRRYNESTGRRIFFEWTLIAGKNDSLAHAQQLAILLRGIDAHVNLIPLNATAQFAGIGSQSGVARGFQKVLQDGLIPCTIRQRRGIDVAAGCGQLRAAHRE